MKFIKLTPKSKVIYEFMDGESFYDHEKEIKEVIQALLQSNMVIVLSFKHTCLDYVEQFLENIPHKEIQRVFHQIPGISGTT
jgi:alpha-D-ribose 1-methylphosphonate 5-triphosphate synthase subunit PhnL